MPDFNRIVLSGTLASGSEEWSTSVAYKGAGGATVTSPEELSDWASIIGAAIDAGGLAAALLNGISSTGAVREVRVYHYPGTSTPASAVGIAAVNEPGTLTPSRPSVTASVLSLQTGLAGRRYRGRMYWPALGGTIDANCRFTSGTISALATAAVDMLQLFTDACPIADQGVPVVVSAAGNLVTPVTSVRVGDVPDTMRSRRDKLEEVYATANV